MKAGKPSCAERASSSTSIAAPDKAAAAAASAQTIAVIDGIIVEAKVITVETMTAVAVDVATIVRTAVSIAAAKVVVGEIAAIVTDRPPLFSWASGPPSSSLPR